MAGEHDLVQFKTRISSEAYNRIRQASERLDVPLQYVIDALVRSFTDDRLVLRVAKQRGRDGVARAAWSRSRKK